MDKGTSAGAFFVGSSQEARRLREEISRAGRSPLNVAVMGETGAGKGLVARLLHEASARPGRFVRCNSARWSGDLLSSEIFGHVRGAFTGADRDRTGLMVHADRGTFFLDEVCELPPRQQAQLLQALDSQSVRPVGGNATTSVDVHIIVASNRDFNDARTSGALRSDFYFRVAEWRISVPPLRERAEDVPELVCHFLAAFPGVEVSGPALAMLQHYPWPGNARELRSEIRTAVVRAAPRTLLEPVDLSDHIRKGELQGDGAIASSPLRWDAEFARCRHTLRVLEHAGWNRTEASKLLGVTRKTVGAWLHRFQRRGWIQRRSDGRWHPLR